MLVGIRVCTLLYHVLLSLCCRNENGGIVILISDISYMVPDLEPDNFICQYIFPLSCLCLYYIVGFKIYHWSPNSFSQGSLTINKLPEKNIRKQLEMKKAKKHIKYSENLVEVTR
jgi:hypothetical protein